MLLAVIVPKRGVSETVATKHSYWNACIPVALSFAVVIATERFLKHQSLAMTNTDVLAEGAHGRWLVAEPRRRMDLSVPEG